MTKAIIFDLGGVIIKPEGVTPKMIAQLFNISIEQVFSVYTQGLEGKWSTGKITTSQIIEKLKAKFPIRKPTEVLVKNLQQLYLYQTRVDPEILSLINELHKNYPVYLLTNTVDIHSQVNKKRGIYKHFDSVYESYLLGIKKPSKKIYELVLRDIKAQPSECFFVDDRQEHITGAKNACIDAVLFISNKELKQELQNRNIKF